MNAEVGQPILTTLVDPGLGVLQGNLLGARIEVPVTREIVAYWRQAVFIDGGLTNQSTYQVLLDPMLGEGDFNICWRTNDAEPPAYETFLPLFVTAAGSLASGGGLVTDFPLLTDPAVLVELTPSVDDVAALERTRTFDDDSQDQGTFNALTKPTDADVEKLIQQALDDTLAALDPAVDPVHYGPIRRAITLGAAILVEGSFFRDDINTEAVNLYRGLARDAVAGVQSRSVVEETSGAVRLV